MQRIEHLFGALPRLVRDLSAELGKQVMVDVEGGDVELDREMIELIRDPLTHIVRNAIDHGIEKPSARLAAGKREIGLLHISARQSGNRIMLSIGDDGAGIDGERLVEKAIAAGIVSAAEGAKLSESERHALIFEPGLSTAEEVTSVSGRGVGMDVVRANIERIGGGIELSSKPGAGTRFQLRLPLTLSIVPALTVESGGQLFAIPRSYVEEILHGASASVEFARVGDAELVTVRGQRVPCLALGDVLGVDSFTGHRHGALVLIRLAGGDLFALSAERIHDHEELVIKPIAPAIMATGIYAGTTLLDDGTPVMMLDIAGIARQAKLNTDVQRTDAVREETAEVERDATVPALVFEALDGRRRAVRMEVVARIDKVDRGALDLEAEQPQAVIGDTIFALAGTDRGALPDGKVTLLRLGDGASEIVYAVRRIVDTADIPVDIRPANSPGEVEGTTLVDGRPVEVLDCFWLFARHAGAPRTAAAPVCRLAEDDPWARSILRPLVEAAGYRVIGEDDGEDADVAIAVQGGAARELRANETIILHSSPDEAGSTGGVYRYDRAGLVAALTSARTRKAS